MAVDSLMGYTDLRLLVDVEPPGYELKAVDVTPKVCNVAFANFKCDDTTIN